MKKTLAAVIGVLIVLGALYYFMYTPEKSAETENSGEAPQALNYKNAFYMIEGKQIRLVNGVHEIPVAPSSSSMVVTKVFGNEAYRDLNNDGRDDVAFLLTQETGGSGTFFYVAVALNLESGYKGSEAYFVGDRIAPQTVEITPDNVIIVNYATRKPGEPMTTRPSVGTSLRIKLDNDTMQFGIVANDFEGEADPSRMKLNMKSWDWISAMRSGAAKIVPKVSGKFSVTFSDDGRFSAKTDCNAIGGEYSSGQNALTFSKMVSTKMYCEGSQEAEFTSLLTDTVRHRFTSRGELIFELKDGGTVVFK